MRDLKEILDEWIELMQDYDLADTIDHKRQSELLKRLSFLSFELDLEFDKYSEQWKHARKNSTAKHEATKTREADEKVPEYELVKRKKDLMSEIKFDIRYTISANKNQ